MQTPTEVRHLMLTAVTEAATRYGVTDTKVTELRDLLCDRPDYGAGFLDGNLTAILVRIADDHHAECVRTECRTCDNVREALAVRLANMTTEAGRRRSRLIRWPR
jgi:hypothetical protein